MNLKSNLNLSLQLIGVCCDVDAIKIIGDLIATVLFVKKTDHALGFFRVVGILLIEDLVNRQIHFLVGAVVDYVPMYDDQQTKREK